MPDPRDPRQHARFAFFRGERLTGLPARATYRLAALAIVSERFEVGRRYAEREVNVMLADDEPDHATLRRLLVNEGLLQRERGAYWRLSPR